MTTFIKVIDESRPTFNQPVIGKAPPPVACTHIGAKRLPDAAVTTEYDPTGDFPVFRFTFNEIITNFVVSIPLDGAGFSPGYELGIVAYDKNDNVLQIFDPLGAKVGILGTFVDNATDAVALQITNINYPIPNGIDRIEVAQTGNSYVIGGLGTSPSSFDNSVLLSICDDPQDFNTCQVQGAPVALNTVADDNISISSNNLGFFITFKPDNYFFSPELIFDASAPLPEALVARAFDKNNESIATPAIVEQDAQSNEIKIRFARPDVGTTRTSIAYIFITTDNPTIKTVDLGSVWSNGTVQETCLEALVGGCLPYPGDFMCVQIPDGSGGPQPPEIITDHFDIVLNDPDRVEFVPKATTPPLWQVDFTVVKSVANSDVQLRFDVELCNGTIIDHDTGANNDWDFVNGGETGQTGIEMIGGGYIFPFQIAKIIMRAPFLPIGTPLDYSLSQFQADCTEGF